MEIVNPGDAVSRLDERARALYAWDKRIEVLTALDNALSALTATRDELERARWNADEFRQHDERLRAELAEQRSRNLTYLANQGALNQRLEERVLEARALLMRAREVVTTRKAAHPASPFMLGLDEWLEKERRR